MKIEKIEIYVIGPEDLHYTWSHDIPPIFQSNTIIKVYTDEEIIGEAGVWNAAYFDYDGLYSYGQQPLICKHNLQLLQEPLAMLVSRKHLDEKLDMFDF